MQGEGTRRGSRQGGWRRGSDHSPLVTRRLSLGPTRALAPSGSASAAGRPRITRWRALPGTPFQGSRGWNPPPGGVGAAARPHNGYGSNQVHPGGHRADDSRPVAAGYSLMAARWFGCAHHDDAGRRHAAGAVDSRQPTEHGDRVRWPPRGAHRLPDAPGSPDGPPCTSPPFRGGLGAGTGPQRGCGGQRPHECPTSAPSRSVRSLPANARHRPPAGV